MTTGKTKKPKKIPLEKRALIPEDPATAGKDRDLCGQCGLCFRCQNCGSAEFGACKPTCPGYEAAHSPFMPATVPDGYTGRLLCVGEGPGATEDEEGKQFKGKSGTLLRKELAEAGFEKKDVAFTNSVRCRVPFNGDPTMTQIRCCRPFLLWEIEKLQPETVLAIGTFGLRALTNDGQASVTNSRGRLLEVPRTTNGGETSGN